MEMRKLQMYFTIILTAILHKDCIEKMVEVWIESAKLIQDKDFLAELEWDKLKDIDERRGTQKIRGQGQVVQRKQKLAK